MKFQELKVQQTFYRYFYNEKQEKWRAQRWNTYEKKNVYNGSYKDEETAAHASDNLARKLNTNGEKRQKLNFTHDHTEVYPEVTANAKSIMTFSAKGRKIS